MPEIILITLAKNLFRILKNKVRNKKNRKGGCTPPINPSPIKEGYPKWADVVLKLYQFTSLHRAYLLVIFHDDQRSRTCLTKSPSFQMVIVVLEMALFRRL